MLRYRAPCDKVRRACARPLALCAARRCCRRRAKPRAPPPPPRAKHTPRHPYIPRPQVLARQQELEELGGGPTRLHRAQLQCVLHGPPAGGCRGGGGTAAAPRAGGGRPLHVLCGARGPAQSARVVADEVAAAPGPQPAGSHAASADAFPLPRGVAELLAGGYDSAVLVCGLGGGDADAEATTEGDVSRRPRREREAQQQEGGGSSGRPFAAVAALVAQAAATLAKGGSSDGGGCGAPALSVSAWALQGDGLLRDALAAGCDGVGGGGGLPPQARPPVTRVRLSGAPGRQVAKLLALADFDAAEAGAAGRGESGKASRGGGGGGGAPRAVFGALDVAFPGGAAASLVVADLTAATAPMAPGATAAAAPASRRGPAAAAAAALAAAAGERARAAARARDFSALSGLVSKLADQQRNRTGGRLDGVPERSTAAAPCGQPGCPYSKPLTVRAPAPRRPAPQARPSPSSCVNRRCSPALRRCSAGHAAASGRSTCVPRRARLSRQTPQTGRTRARRAPS
jgi:hypothetical protein